MCSRSFHVALAQLLLLKYANCSGPSPAPAYMKVVISQPESGAIVQQMSAHRSCALQLGQATRAIVPTPAAKCTPRQHGVPCDLTPAHTRLLRRTVRAIGWAHLFENFLELCRGPIIIGVVRPTLPAVAVFDTTLLTFRACFADWACFADCGRRAFFQCVVLGFVIQNARLCARNGTGVFIPSAYLLAASCRVKPTYGGTTPRWEPREILARANGATAVPANGSVWGPECPLAVWAAHPVKHAASAMLVFVTGRSFRRIS